MTWARDGLEEGRLRQSIPYLAELQIPTYVTDAGSGIEFIEFLRSFPHFTVCQAAQPGLWPQVRQSLEAAQRSAAPFLLYTEPDKLEFFRDHLSQLISEAPEDRNLGALIPGRSDAGFSTFPEFQRFTETAINRCCAERTGRPGDYSYGPFFLNRELLGELRGLAEEIGWGWRIYTLAMTHLMNYRIEFLEKDFVCPAEQREDSHSERLYRMRQLAQSLAGLVCATRGIDGNA